VRALLLKSAALGAAIALALFGVALVAFGTIDAPAASAQSSDCGSPTASPSPSASSSPMPSSSDSSPASTSPSATVSPTPQLCVEVDPYPSSGDVLPGDPATYEVSVSSVDADSSNVTATASVAAASYLGSPSYSICPSASGATCTIASLPVGDVAELLVSVQTTSAATPDTDIVLTVSVAATGSSSDSASGTDVVVAPTPASSASSSSSSSSGLGDTSSTVPPLESLPSIPGTGVTATNPSDLFPTVSPSPSSGSLGLPPAKVHHVVAAADATYAVPIDPRLLGAQIVGLVALAGAITIAIVRLSLRKPLPAAPRPADPPDKTVAS
jgi:hypothetical protein